MGTDEPRDEAGSARRRDTEDPRGARERALKILFQADVRQVTPEVTLRRLDDDPAAQAMLDEVEDLAEGTELLPPIASEPGVEVERVPQPEAPRRRSGAASGASRRRGAGPAPIDGFTRRLVLGVHEHRAEVDALISRFARRWQISRMPVVDRTILRLATFELLYETTSPAVTISEAVGLARDLSTDDSGRYVNGVLESIRRHLASTDGDPAAAETDTGEDQDPTSGDGDPEDLHAAAPAEGDDPGIGGEVTAEASQTSPDDSVSA